MTYLIYQNNLYLFADDTNIDEDGISWKSRIKVNKELRSQYMA